jgi:glutamate-1-semialdehyde 2,1-aminomutase
MSRAEGQDPASFHSDGRAGARSSELFQRACEVIPGGVNSPVRAFKAVGGDPPFIRRAEGPYLFTEDGARLIDYVGSWGPAILGHAHPAVIDAVQRAAKDGLSFGAATAAEIDFAELLTELVPALGGGMVRLVSSGTEATMSALRLARGFTGRRKIIKFDGGYHGHADFLLVAAGSGAATLGIPGSAGVPDEIAEHTLVLPFNDVDAIDRAFAASGDDIAAIIVEPVAGNMGCVPPRDGYLEHLRSVCDRYGTLLVFDEVMTGFRVALGGAGAHYGVKPDLVTLGKIAGGGLPLGAYGGRRDVMAKIAPLGPVYQAGTLSGNPLAVAAGRTTLELLRDTNPYVTLAARTRRLADGLLERARKHDVPLVSTSVGAMFGFFFQPDPVWSYADAKRSDVDAFGRWFLAMLSRGVYMAPSQFEAAFTSTTHDDAIIDQTLAAADEAFAELARG